MAACWPSEGGPIPLSYRVEAGEEGVLRSRSLAVRHDQSALHLLADHGVAIIGCLAVVGWVWGGGWSVVWVVSERRHRRRAAAATVDPGVPPL